MNSAVRIFMRMIGGVVARKGLGSADMTLLCTVVWKVAVCLKFRETGSAHCLVRLISVDTSSNHLFLLACQHVLSPHVATCSKVLSSSVAIKHVWRRSCPCAAEAADASAVTATATSLNTRPLLQSVRERQQLNVVAFPRSLLFAEVSEDHGSIHLAQTSAMFCSQEAITGAFSTRPPDSPSRCRSRQQCGPTTGWIVVSIDKLVRGISSFVLMANQGLRDVPWQSAHMKAWSPGRIVVRC